MTKLWKIIGALVSAVVIGLVVSSIYTHHKTQQATQHQHDADIAEGQAQAHAANAQAIPTHEAEIKAANAKAAEAEARADDAEAKALRAKRERDAALAKLEAQQFIPDARDEVISKDKVLIEAQGNQIVELKSEVATQKAQVLTLTLALTDEQKRSGEWKAAYEAAERRAAAQEAATKAWKGAVAGAQWKGGFKGFAAGALVGLLLKH